MLIKCPECELMMSDKAIACPHCGMPNSLITDFTSKKKRTKSKRQRLPNGFGRITEIKNVNLRNRFRAMITVGKNSVGKPIGEILGYFPTYNEAYEALVEYHRNPYDIRNSISVMELYEKWSEKYFETLRSESSARTVIAAWRYCSSIYDMRVSDVKVRHLKGCIEDGQVLVTVGKDKGTYRKASPETKSRMKSIFNLMFDYALEYELTDKNYARMFELSNDIIVEKEKRKRGHIKFSKEEICTLWNNISIPFVDMIIIQCYMGWRPQELVGLLLSDVHLDEKYIQGGMKTAAGKNRIVPIHPSIQNLIESRYKEALSLNSEYLFNDASARNVGSAGTKLTYDKYNYRFSRLINDLSLNLEHRPHDPRKHFITLAKNNSLDEYAIKLIVGHNIEDITERVYTDRDIEWLINEVKKIKVEF